MPTLEELNAAVTRGIAPLQAPLRLWRGVCLHHSYKPTLPVWGRNYAEIFNRIHLEERGWPLGCGYHFVISWNETECIAWSTFRWRHQLDGAHAVNTREYRWPYGEGHQLIVPNKELIGICVVGDFDQVEPPNHLRAFVRDLCSTLFDSWGVGDATLQHNHFAPKTCPGMKWRW